MASRKKPGRSVSRLRATAYHEAGHAVVAYLFGATIIQLDLLEASQGDLRITGSCYHTLAPSEDAAGATRREIMMSLAGSVAEDRYVGRRQPDDAGDQRDVYRKRKLDELLGRGDFAIPPGNTFHVAFGQRTKELYVAWLRARVTDLLSARVVWSAVRHLARELLARKTMDGPAVHALLESRLPRLGEEYTEEPDGARQVKFVPVKTRPAR